MSTSPLHRLSQSNNQTIYLDIVEAPLLHMLYFLEPSPVTGIFPSFRSQAKPAQPEEENTAKENSRIYSDYTDHHNVNQGKYPEASNSNRLYPDLYNRLYPDLYNTSGTFPQGKLNLENTTLNSSYRNSPINSPRKVRNMNNTLFPPLTTIMHHVYYPSYPSYPVPTTTIINNESSCKKKEKKEKKEEEEKADETHPLIYGGLALATTTLGSYWMSKKWKRHNQIQQIHKEIEECEKFLYATKASHPEIYYNEEVLSIEKCFTIWRDLYPKDIDTYTLYGQGAAILSTGGILLGQVFNNLFYTTFLGTSLIFSGILGVGTLAWSYGSKVGNEDRKRKELFGEITDLVYGKRLE